MIRRSVQRQRRRVVARMLEGGASVNAIAKHLRIGWESANREVQYVRARLDTAEYVTVERALVVTIERFQALEDEAHGYARNHGLPGELANRWFESARRAARHRGQLLAKLRALQHANGRERTSEQALPPLQVSHRAQALQARIARAEQLGIDWDVTLAIEDTDALEPVPDPLVTMPEMPAAVTDEEEVDPPDAEAP